MNNKNLLLLILMFVNTASAMKRKGEPHRCETYEKRNELISFKSLQGFPLISLDNGQKWAERLSETELKKVRKQIMWQKDERLTALLHMIELPQELQRLIAAHIFEGYKKVTNRSNPLEVHIFDLCKKVINLSNLQVFAEYKNAADLFCTMPLCDVLDQYDLSMQIFQDPEKYSVKPNLLPLHLIFEYARDIKVNHNIQERKCNICSQQELESVARVMNVFGKYVDHYDCRYQFYDQPIMTINNFKKQWNGDQFCLLLVFLATYVLSTFPDGCDYVLNQDNIEFNKVVYEFNQDLSLLVQKTGRKSFWESRVKGLDPHDCFINDFGACKISAGIVMATVVLYYCHRYHEYWRTSAIAIRERYSLRFTGALVGCLAWGTLIGWKASFSMLLYLSSCFPGGSFVGTGCMALVYAMACSGYNIHKMNRLQEGCVWRQHIPELLQRTDIQII